MRDLPTGIVTFLFTDVEGSTRLLERLGERYRGVQERHDAILRSANAHGNGHEVSTEGDAFFAAFPSPTGAVRAAAAAQRDLAAATWPDASRVRVRMGIHTGEGHLGGESYLSLDVNRTARIAAAAHGGQVLMSDATRGLVERSLPSGAHLQDLGFHQLKDFHEPQRLFQLVIDGLEQAFPPLRTPGAGAGSLPTPATRFIGRRGDVAEIQALVAASRLVTLTGPGGTGKTRLALQVASELGPSFRDGSTFVDLSALTDADLVAQEIAGALRIRVEPGRAVSEVLADDLQDKELLLVLDNFEQVLAAGLSVVEPLSREASGLRMLITSRVPLHLYGEREYPVSPLGVPDPERLPDLEGLMQLDAVALFAERAGAVRPGFRVTPRNARAVAEITNRLDGLPLAIELAASRIKVVSPAELLARLGQRLPLLSAQDRNVPERQRTLRRTIEWSYDLLETAEQQMFWRLSVFAAGADLEAVEAVVNPLGEIGVDSLDGLTSLVDKNLIRRGDTEDGGTRFTMLETIREYGLERLDSSGEAPAIRRRHVERWIVLGDQVNAMAAEEQADSVRVLELDHDNLRSALSWVVREAEGELGLRLGAALRFFWRVGNHFAEGVHWLALILALPTAAGPSPARARALTAASDLASWMRESDAHLRQAEEAVAIYRELADARGIADALGELGVAQIAADQGTAALASLEEARALSLGMGERQIAAEATMALGLLSLTKRDTVSGRAHVQDALATFTDLGDMYWIAFAERLLGGIDRFEGDDVAAEQRFRTSIATAREHGVLIMVASDLYAFADLAVLRGQPERAVRLVGASVAIRERTGDAPSMEMEMVGDVRAAAAASLDAGTAERLYDEGHEMVPDDAIDYALGT